MDRTQELAELRKKLYEVRCEVAKYNKEPELKKDLEDKAKVIHNKMSKLLLEMKINTREKGRKL